MKSKDTEWNLLDIITAQEYVDFARFYEHKASKLLQFSVIITSPPPLFKKKKIILEKSDHFTMMTKLFKSKRDCEKLLTNYFYWKSFRDSYKGFKNLNILLNLFY